MQKYAKHAHSPSSVPLLPFAERTTLPTARVLYGFKSRTHGIFSASKRRILLVVCVCASVVFTVTLVIASASTHTKVVALQPGAQPSLDNADLPHNNVTHSLFVLGPPTPKFRDNLRADTKYITSWISAGWTNDVMTYANLIYLGTLTDRVPIIPLFIPSEHMGDNAPSIAFSAIFDVPRFTLESGINIIEWNDIKNPESEEVEDLGCWNVWESVQKYEHNPRRSYLLDQIGLDVSYTKTPEWIKLIPNYEHDKCSSFWSLARLAFPEERAKHLGTAAPSPKHGAFLDPDEHVLCYDYLYYACAQQSSEYEYDYAPAWRYVAKHFRWTQHINDLTEVYVNRAFGLDEAANTPEYITVHVRHGDFGNYCSGAETPEDCFAPLPVIARRVREVQDELRERKAIDIPMTRVIMTSDETDEEWWAEVEALGWARVNHDTQRTVELYGRWYPVILDAAIQSNGLGFVGTDVSTFSVLSKRRVEDWQDGATRMVKWGRKDADAH